MKRQGGQPTPAWLLVPGVIESLKAAWAAGSPIVEMGRLFGTTPNAIIGKVHRLGLDPRTSPILFGPPLPPRRYEGQPRTLPPLVSEQAAPRPVAAPIPIAAPRVAAPMPARVAAPIPKPIPNAECCWPIGEPGTKSFRFCEGTALPERPYCAAHCAKAYIPLRQRAANAAAMGGD